VGVSTSSQWELAATHTAEEGTALGKEWFGPTGEEFAAAYEAATGEKPTYHVAGGYVAGLVLQKAIQDADSIDPEKVKAALEDFKSLSRKEKRDRIRDVKKELREYNKAKRAGDDASDNTVLLCILAILLPPLAVYLHQGEIKVLKGNYKTYGVNLQIVRGRIFYAGGVAAISRWLSAAIPPVDDGDKSTTPEGNAVNDFLLRKTGLYEN
jgi:hypothetical protein